MSTPELPERLNRAVHAIEAAAQAVRTAVIRERAVVKFFVATRTLNASVGELMATLDESVRDLQDGKFDSVEPVQAGESMDATEMIQKMEIVYRLLNGVYVLATVVGLKNKRLTKGEVKKLHDSAEHLLDYIVWLKDAATPEARADVDAHFAEAMHELESGETVTFA